MLPPLLSELAASIGAEAALAVSAFWGGRRAYIPKSPNERLISVVGTDAALWMSRAYGGDTLEVPFGPYSTRAQTRHKVMTMTAEGKSARVIAAALGIATRTVERHRARARKDASYDH